MIEIYGGESSLPQTGDNKLSGWRHLALRVDSLVAAKAELEQRGLKFTEDRASPPAVAAGFCSFRIPKATCFTWLSGRRIRASASLGIPHGPAGRGDA